ncbi:MAG: PLD nuclease N-terminal domain-containing protein [Chloroflexota bacterium]
MHMNINGMRLGRQMRWADLPQSVRGGLGIAASVQMALLISAIVDLVRRPSSQVRGGRKWAWVPVLFVNLIGPLAYFAFGRVHGDTSDNPALRL